MIEYKRHSNSIKDGMMEFGETIGAIVNFVLLTVVYVFGIGITSIFAKIVRKKFLETDFQEESYWSDLDLKKEPEESYYRQF